MSRTLAIGDGVADGVAEVKEAFVDTVKPIEGVVADPIYENQGVVAATAQSRIATGVTTRCRP